MAGNTREKEHTEMTSREFMNVGKRAILMITAIAATLMACSGVALAVTAIGCGSLLQDPLTPLCEGTNQDDDILGRNASDTILAFAGNDTVYGGAGRDSLAGGPGDDGIFGGKGADSLTDDLNFTADKDELRGGGGNDTLDAWDNDYDDTLVCGPGNDDTAYFDLNTTLLKHDEVSPTCENRRPSIKIDPRQ
jgi:hypothetical protein